MSQNKRFWKMIDDAIARGQKEGYVDLADLMMALAERRHHRRSPRSTALGSIVDLRV